MYWYFKYPLLLICLLALTGIVLLTYRSCRSEEPQGPDNGNAPVVQTTDQNPAVAPATDVNQSGANAAQTTGVNADVQDLENRLKMAKTQFDSGAIEAARRIAELVMKDSRVTEFDSIWFQAADIINEVNYRFMNSTAPCSEKQRYMVKPGDTMQRIAKNTITCTEFLLRLNPAFRREKGDPIIHPGDALFYIPTAWRIRVIKHRYLLILYREDKFYRYYRIGIGRENRTPVGSFVISGRQEHPSWTPPGKNIPYGEPENILGTHWLALKPVGDTDPATLGYGIHGTWDDDSIGTAASSGCVRMHNEDVNELYDAIPNPGYCPPVFVDIEE